MGNVRFGWLQSIRWRAALLTSGLVAIVLVVFIGYAYREVEAQLVRTGEERAQNAADQLADLFARGTQTRVAEMQRASVSQVVRQALQTPEAPRTDAEARLRPLLTGTQHQTLELWTVTGERVVAFAAPTVDNTLPPSTPPKTAGVMPYQSTAAGSVITEIVTEVRNQDAQAAPQTGPLLGYLVSRRASATTGTSDVFNRLVGGGAPVLAGNRDGSIWTDFSRIVPPPSSSIGKPGAAVLQALDGQKVIGGNSLIEDSPWAVSVEFPYATVVAPAGVLLGRLATVGLLFIAIASVAVWALSARVTMPLDSLTGAADAIAAGDYSRRVAVHRHNEVGRLSEAFNRMAEQVQVGRQQLEARAQELHESETRESAVIRGALDGIITIDAAGTMTEFNPAAEKKFGYSRDEALGQSFTRLVSLPSYHGQGPDAFANYVGSSEVIPVDQRIELRSHRKDGTEFVAEVSIISMRSGDSRIFSAFVRDLTSQKTAEQARLRSVQLEEENRRVQEASRLKSEFLANMSHELRTPLNAIIGFAELLHDGEVTPDMPQFREFLGDILSSGQHLLQLINDVLDLSKVEAGRLDFYPETFDLQQAVAEVIGILRTASAQKQLVVTHEIAESVREVMLDRARLKQVLYNYLSNAIKFTPEGGRVTVRAVPEGAAVRLEVHDTGVGIAPADISRLFIEFNQLEAGTAKKHQGTGLGLALTKRLVEAQRGSVGVSSVPGQGSVFFAVLPKQADGTPRPGPRSFASTRIGAPSVLVVEDNLRDQNALVETLVTAGYAVETATTGAEAFAKIDSLRFDAVTLDLILPDLTGTDVLRYIRASERNRDVTVIVITIVALDGAVAGFAVHDILPKPVDGARVLASLSAAGVSAEQSGEVLVVDDDPGSLRLMAALLDQLGYRSHCFDRGAAALRYCGERAPLAVVLDLQMPEMDGLEFLSRFRDLPHCSRTPVIVWTVKDLTSDDYTRLRLGAQSIVAKGQLNNASVLNELQRHLPQPEKKASS